jgi:predicted metal-dependent peptidase
MPGEGEYVELPPDRSAEEYYSLLPEPPAEGGAGEQGGADPGRCGGVRDPGDGSPADAADQEADWRAATARAEAAARARGGLPAGLARSVDQVLRPPADWRAVLRDFVSQQARSDFAWTRPNRRFIAQGLYLPGMYSEELGEVVIAVDCSGSISKEQLEAFATEVNGVLSAYACTVTVLYHDSDVQGAVEFSSADRPVTLEPVGGGGTSHVCVFDWLKRDGRQPACLIALTDLETEFPPDPGVPVLWAVTGPATAAPFGRVVAINP